MGDWRISCNTLAFITEDGKIYLAPEDSKKLLITQVLKKITTGYTERHLTLPDDLVNVKVEADLNVSIKLKDSDTWYLAGNFDKSCLGAILLESPNVNAKFSEDFYILIDEDCKGEFRLLSQSQPKFKEFQDDLVRRTNWIVKSKCKVKKVGHRYDSRSGSIYYLGEFKSKIVLDRKKGFKYIDISNFRDMDTVQLYVTELKPSDKTVSDILKDPDRGVGIGALDIKVTNKFPNLIDLGESLQNDFDGNITPYLEKLALRALSDAVSVNKNSVTGYRNCKYFFKALTLCTSGYEDVQFSENIKSTVFDLLKKLIVTSIIDQACTRPSVRDACIGLEPNNWDLDFMNYLNRALSLTNLNILGEAPSFYSGGSTPFGYLEEFIGKELAIDLDKLSKECYAEAYELLKGTFLNCDPDKIKATSYYRDLFDSTRIYVFSKSEFENDLCSPLRAPFKEDFMTVKDGYKDSLWADKFERYPSSGTLIFEYNMSTILDIISENPDEAYRLNAVKDLLGEFPSLPSKIVVSTTIQLSL